MYLIYSEQEKLYWSNSEGWIDREEASVFTEEERKTLDLPIGGQWVKK